MDVHLLASGLIDADERLRVPRRLRRAVGATGRADLPEMPIARALQWLDRVRDRSANHHAVAGAETVAKA